MRATGRPLVLIPQMRALLPPSLCVQRMVGWRTERTRPLDSLMAGSCTVSSVVTLPAATSPASKAALAQGIGEQGLQVRRHAPPLHERVVVLIDIGNLAAVVGPDGPDHRVA